MQKIFNGFGSCNYIVTQQRAPNLKFSSHMDYICRKYVVKVTKTEQKLTIIDHIYFCVQKSLKTLSNQIFLRIARKATYSVCVGQISALFTTYCISHALKSVDTGLENGQFLSFPIILTPTTSNLYTVLASK